MNAPQVGINSYGHLIKLKWLERMKLVPPFNAVGTTYGRTPSRPVQPEQVPFLGVYHLNEDFGPDGDANMGEPRFFCSLNLGYSYVVQNNDTDQAEDFLDQAHWSFMKLLHDAHWKDFDLPNDVRVEAVTKGSYSKHYGNIGSNANALPIAELRMEFTYTYRIGFDPIIPDLFLLFHGRTLPHWPEEPGDLPIITEWVLEKRPLPTYTTLAYLYDTTQKDPAALPADGAIVHPSDALETMRIAKIGQGGQDNSAFLATIKVGDQITIATAPTWTVVGIQDEPTCVHIVLNSMKWSNASGVQDFTFAIFT